MTPEEKTQLNNLENKLNEFLSVYYRTNPTGKVQQGDPVQFLNTVSFYRPFTKSIIITKDLTEATAVTNTAHGLGKIPAYVKATSFYTDGTHVYMTQGTYDGTYQRYTAIMGAGSGAPYEYTSNAKFMFLHPVTGAYQEAEISMDGTNINLSWTKTGSPTGQAYIMLEYY